MRDSRGVCWGGLLLFGLVAGPTAAQEDERSASWLRLSAPDGCPDARAVEARIDELLGRPVPNPSGLDVRAVITFHEPEWEVDVTLAVGQARGTRRLRAKTCTDVADFVALTVVLAVDPAHAAPTVEPAEPTSATFPDEPPPESAARTDGPSAAPPPPPVQRGSRRLSLSAGVEGLVGTLPSVRVGPTASVRAGFGSVWLELGGAYFPGVSEGADIAANPIALSLAHARARGCLLSATRPLAGGPCLSVDVGAMMADEVVMGGRRATELYVALGAGARGALRLTSHVWLLAHAGLTVPLTQPRFVLSDGTLVHQPQLGGTASLELSLRWPE